MIVLMSVQMVNSKMELNALHVQKLAELAKTQIHVKNVKHLMLCLVLNVFQFAHQAHSVIMDNAETAQITAMSVTIQPHAQFAPLLQFSLMANALKYVLMVLLRTQTTNVTHAPKIVKHAIQQNLVKNA